MIKVIEMRTEIGAFLKTLHARVFFHSAPDNATYPYIVFDLPNSVDSGSLENFVLDVDAWDDEDNTTALETLIGTIDNALHKKTIFINDKMSITIYRESRFVLLDDDRRLHRRKYTYQARTYEKHT